MNIFPNTYMLFAGPRHTPRGGAKDFVSLVIGNRETIRDNALNLLEDLRRSDPDSYDPAFSWWHVSDFEGNILEEG